MSRCNPDVIQLRTVGAADIYQYPRRGLRTNFSMARGHPALRVLEHKVTGVPSPNSDHQLLKQLLRSLFPTSFPL
jgi:hypothetical protein